MPKSNRKFWKQKLEGNVERDKINRSKLQNMGFKVIFVWECWIKNREFDKISKILKKELPKGEKVKYAHSH